MWKRGAGDRSKISLQLSLFGLHLFLGNWWNGAPFTPVGLVALAVYRATTLSVHVCAFMRWSSYVVPAERAMKATPVNDACPGRSMYSFLGTKASPG